MNKFAFFKQDGYGAEKFYFEDGEENTVIIAAESDAEAEEKLLAAVDEGFADEARKYLAEEVDGMDRFPYCVEW